MTWSLDEAERLLDGVEGFRVDAEIRLKPLYVPADDEFVSDLIFPPKDVRDAFWRDQERYLEDSERPRRLAAVLASLEPVEDEMPMIQDAPPEPVDL